MTVDDPGQHPASAPRDPGVQPERTALSWQRTALSTGLVSTVLALACLRAEFPLGALVACAVSVAAAVVLLLSRRVPPLGARRPTWTSLTRTVALVVAMVVVGAVLALLLLLR